MDGAGGGGTFFPLPPLAFACFGPSNIWGSFSPQKGCFSPFSNEIRSLVSSVEHS